MSNEPITTVLSSAASYNLTDLATVKDELEVDAGDTGNDAWLTRALGQVSSAVMNDTNRVFAPEFVQDLFDIRRARYQVPNGQCVLQLSRWPVLAVTSVVISLVGQNAPLSLVENTDFRVDYATGEIYRLNSDTGTVSAWEALPVAVRYSGGYGAAVSEAHTVPATPFQVTVTQAATFSCDQQVSYVSSGLPLVRVASGPTVGQYSVSAAGVYTFAAADTSKALTFAYATISVPSDLVDATLQLITARFRAKGRDPSLIQRDTPGLGTERFWFGGAPGQAGPFPPSIAGMLDNYKVPVVS
jgi:hypothetical protein